jgi:phospholipid transport system substrate-binding protein
VRALPPMIPWTHGCSRIFWQYRRGDRRSGTGTAFSGAMKLPSALFFAVVAMVTLCMPWHATAGAPTDQLRARIERIQKIVTAVDARPEDRKAAIAAMDDIFDWPAIAQNALRAQWQVRTPEEREEFTRLFAHFFALVYTSKVQMGQAERFEFLGESIEGGRAVVRTTTIMRSGDERHVTYRMRLHGGERWKIYEFDVDGMNLIENYGAQFQQIVTRGSYKDLAKKLRETSAALEK